MGWFSFQTSSCKFATFIAKFSKFYARRINSSNTLRVVNLTLLNFSPTTITNMRDSCLCFLQKFQTIIFAHNICFKIFSAATSPFALTAASST